jgi:multidrug resistance efflux pump
MSELEESVFEGPDGVVVKPKIRARKVKEVTEPKEKPLKKGPSLKKLDPETAKLLASLREKANKKELGRKVKDSELLHLGLTLITPNHIETLQQATYSEQDHLALAHNEYQRVNGKLTLNQFLGKLLRGEINPK